MLLSFLMAVGAAVRARTTRGVAYGSVPGAKLDVYAPVGADGEAPVILFAHSGCAPGARRHLFRFVGLTLASRGFITVIPDVRPEADARQPAFLEDMAKAVAWAKANAPAYGGDPRRLFLMGHVGGAYAAMMLTLDPRWLGSAGLEPREIRGAIGISGAFDGDGSPGACPADHADPSAPPVLLIAGQRDVIDPDNTSRMASALRTCGGQVAEIRYPTLGDRLGLQSVAATLRYRATALDEVERFVRLYSLGPAA